jgi:hypothetical protein
VTAGTPTTFSYAGKPYGPPYTCLKEYQENPNTHENNIGRFNANGTPYNVPGGQSAAQIIWDAAQLTILTPKLNCITPKRNSHSNRYMVSRLAIRSCYGLWMPR